MAQRTQQSPAIQASDLKSDRAGALKLTPVSRETLSRLDAYIDLLLQWQAKTNLIASSTLSQLWTRHVADSLQLLTLAPRALIWADLGSGGGFPGVVLACALADRFGAHVHLVERNAKKAAFLREAVRVSGAAATVHPVDIGDSVDRLPARIDCVTARALAPLHQLLTLTEPWLLRGAAALFPKGQDVESELSEATRYWKMTARLYASLTDPDGRIIEISAIDRKTAEPR